MSKSSILCCIQSNLSLLKYNQFSQTWSSSLYIVKASVFSIYSIESPDVCLDRDLGLLGPIFSPPICCLACIQPYIQPASSLQQHLFPVPDIFLARTSFSPECLTQQQCLLFRHQSPSPQISRNSVFCFLPQNCLLSTPAHSISPPSLHDCMIIKLL